jgi:uncharacterized membrane protein YdbT with pleckstrin-like domain
MDLQPGEHVIYEGHPSWRSTLGFYLLGLLAAAAAGAIAYFASGAGLAAAVGGGVLLVALIVGWLRRITTRYLITNRKLQIRHGILSKNVEHTRVERIVDVTVRQSVWQRILAIGAVDFDNASGQGQDLFRFTGIASPYEVTQAVNQAHEEQAADGGARPQQQQTGV